MVKLTIIGLGNMGQYSANALSHKVESIGVYDPKKTDAEIGAALTGVTHQIYRSASEAVVDADFVLYCVPTDLVASLMRESLPNCKEGAIISGQTSRKGPERDAFDEYKQTFPHSGLEMVSIHTMCNPAASNPKDEILAIVPNCCSPTAHQRAIDFYGGMSEHVEQFKDVNEHDKVLACTQVNTSRTVLSVAGAFANAGCFPWVDGSYGSGLDVMKFALAMRAASLPAHVYRGIQFGNKDGQNFVALSKNVGSGLMVMLRDPKNFAGDLTELILGARTKLFGEKRRKTILKDEDVNGFSTGRSFSNSHISLVLNALDDVEKGRNPFAYMKGTTPMHTAQLCLQDYLFNAPGLLEQSLQSMIDGVTLGDDEVFFDEWWGWEEAIRLQQPEKYDWQHRKMMGKLKELVAPELMRRHLDLSKEVVAVCRTRMKEAIDSKLIEIPKSI